MGRPLSPSPVETALQVPGDPGKTTAATFTLTNRQSFYRNEVGIFLVDDATGRIGNLKPGDPGYAAAATSRRRVLFHRGQGAGSVTQIELPAGSHYGIYLIQNGTSERFLARNPGNRKGHRPLAFFSFSAANLDRYRHVRFPSENVWAIEDMLHGGDRDHDDAVVKVAYALDTVIIAPDTTAPAVTVRLHPDSDDLAPAGDDVTTLGRIVLVGETEPGLLVKLVETGQTTRSDAAGRYTFSGVPLDVGSRAFHVEATDAAGNVGKAQRLITRCGFLPGLTGWEVSERGGTPPGAGGVTEADGRAVLREGNSFEVVFRHDFVIPANPSTISFAYADLAFDTTDPSFINDAFEVALLGDNGVSLVPTFAAGRDAFFNVTEGLAVARGSGTTQNGQTVTVDLAGRIPGTTASLVFRLVNNDGDTASSVAIACAAGLPGSLGTTSRGAAALTASADRSTLPPPPPGAFSPRSSLAMGEVPVGPVSAVRASVAAQVAGGPPAQSPVGDSLLDADGNVTFTTSEDFLQGTLFNTDATTNQDQIGLLPPGQTQTFPFIWVSNSGEGTVSRFDTRTGQEIGRYRTGPGNYDPSRIAVTGEGDAWVANRGGPGTVVKVLLNDFIDRNGNGVVDTCVDLNGDGRITGSEVLAWDANGDGQPDDERISFVVTVGGGPRGVAIDANDKVWISPFSGARQFFVFDNKTGVQEAIVPTGNFGSYGATIDANGQLWSATGAGASTLVHIDTNTRTFVGTVQVASAYGITVDRDGIVWTSPWSGTKLSRYDPSKNELTTYDVPATSGAGITVDRQGNVWFGTHNSNRVWKFTFEADRKTLKSSEFVTVGSAPKSASIDADGFFWTVCLNSNEVYKIDTTTNTIVPGWPKPTG
ncbi:MAG: DUF4114 domain-containing protein, partial [Isosphaeraceae bacterium]